MVHVIARLNVGGPALIADVLTRGLDPARFEQLLLAGSVGPGEEDYVDLRAPDLPVQRVQGLGRDPDPMGDARALSGLSRAMDRFRPHIVHTHTAKAGVLGRLTAWRRRVPATVHTFHGHLLHGYFSPAKTRLVVGTEQLMARRTTRLVAVGAQVRDDLLAAGIGRPDQFAVVPPGVSLPRPPSRSEARSALGLPAAGPVVTFVARLTQVKRPERFVDMAIEVARHHPSAVFAVAGEGDLLTELRDRAALLGGRVAFLGWRRDVETVYAASDVVVLTSDNEGMPVSLIEAALAARPAVSTRVGSAPEVVADGETGILVESTSAALAQGVSVLLDDAGLRERMGTAAQARAREEFSQARLVAATAELYEDLTRRDGFPLGA